MTTTDKMKRCREARPDDAVAAAQARLAALLQDMQVLMGVLPAHHTCKPGELEADLAEENFDNLPV
ncbi:MAG: hypothetical protein Q8Q26_08370 [Pseudorhodobacter sp.]|nr:hypothetical protein [Pseudorhodobacter sp.]